MNTITIYKINDKQYTSTSVNTEEKDGIILHTINLQLIRQKKPDPRRVGRPIKYINHCDKHTKYTRACPNCKALRNQPDFNFQLEDNIKQELDD